MRTRRGATAPTNFPPLRKTIRRTRPTDSDRELYRQADAKCREEARFAVQEVRRTADPMMSAANWGATFSGMAMMVAGLALVISLPGGPELAEADYRSILLRLLGIASLLIVMPLLYAGFMHFNFSRRSSADRWRDAYRDVDQLERDEAEREFRREMLAVVRRHEQHLDQASTDRGQRRRHSRPGSR